MASHRSSRPVEVFPCRLLGPAEYPIFARERVSAHGPASTWECRHSKKGCGSAESDHQPWAAIATIRRAERLSSRSPQRQNRQQPVRTVRMNPAARTIHWTCTPATFCRTNPCGRVIVMLSPGRVCLPGSWASRLLRHARIADPFVLPTALLPRYRKNPCVQVRLPKTSEALNGGLNQACAELVRIEAKL